MRHVWTNGQAAQGQAASCAQRKRRYGASHETPQNETTAQRDTQLVGPEKSF